MFRPLNNRGDEEPFASGQTRRLTPRCRSARFISLSRHFAGTPIAQWDHRLRDRRRRREAELAEDEGERGLANWTHRHYIGHAGLPHLRRPHVPAPRNQRTKLTKLTFAFVAALVLAPASSALAQRHRQIDYPHRAAGFHSVPTLTRPRNSGEAALDCNATYRGFRLCDWLRPSPPFP